MSLYDAWMDRRVRTGAALAAVGVFCWLLASMSGFQAARRSQGHYRVRGARLLDDEKDRTNLGTKDAYYVEYTAQNGQKYRCPEPISRFSFRDGNPDLGVELFVSKRDPADAWLVNEGPPSMIPAALGYFVGAVFLCIACILGLRPLQEACRKVDAAAPENPPAGNADTPAQS